MVDQFNTSDRHTGSGDIPDSPEYFTENSAIPLSREISFLTAKSSGLQSEKSNYNARLDLMERDGASNLPGERSQEMTPVSNAGDYTFMMDDRALVCDVNSPLMKYSYAVFDDDDDDVDVDNKYADDDDDNFGDGEDEAEDDDDDRLSRERSSLTNQKTPKSSKTPFESMRLKERTLTDLSQVGPLPTFMARDNTTRNFDDISTDSAFDSAVSYSEYAASHFSEKMTLSHGDQQSSKHSQVSEENNMFDVDLVSHLDYEGESDWGVDLNSDIDFDSLHEFDSFKSMKGFYSRFNLDLETINSMSVSSMRSPEKFESGKITVTPRSSTFANTPRFLPSTTTPQYLTPATPKTPPAQDVCLTSANVVTTKPPLAPRNISQQKDLKSGKH